MIKGCKIFFKRKSIYDFDAFLNAESIDCFIFLISYTAPEMTKKNKKKKKSNGLTIKTLYLTVISHRSCLIL